MKFRVMRCVDRWAPQGYVWLAFNDADGLVWSAALTMIAAINSARFRLREGIGAMRGGGSIVQFQPYAR
jgi:hypothetical protein